MVTFPWLIADIIVQHHGRLDSYYNIVNFKVQGEIIISGLDTMMLASCLLNNLTQESTTSGSYKMPLFFNISVITPGFDKIDAGIDFYLYHK